MKKRPFATFNAERLERLTTQNLLPKHGLSLDHIPSFHFPLETRQSALQFFPGAEVCAGPDLPCSGCVSTRDIRAMGLEGDLAESPHKQQPLCRYAGGKVEPLRKGSVKPDRCLHGCLYCFWGRDECS